MSGELEVRYERLLRWYPEHYRRERGAEMLGVLMDGAAADRRRPALRERLALVVGGLRMRAGTYGQGTAWQSWRAALRTAALILVVLNVADATAGLGWHEQGAIADIAKIILGALAAGAILRDYFSVAVGATVAMVAVEGFIVMDGSLIRIPVEPGVYTFAPGLVVVLLLPLVGRGPVRVTRSLNVLAALALIPAGLWAISPYSTDYANAFRASWWYLLAAAVLWAVVDERLALTLGLVLLYNVAYQVPLVWRALSYGEFGIWSLIAIAIASIMPVIGVTAGAVVARRRARV